MFGLNLGTTSSSGGGAYDFGNYIQPDGVNDLTLSNFVTPFIFPH